MALLGQWPGQASQSLGKDLPCWDNPPCKIESAHQLLHLKERGLLFCQKRPNGLSQLVNLLLGQPADTLYRIEFYAQEGDPCSRALHLIKR